MGLVTVVESEAVKCCSGALAHTTITVVEPRGDVELRPDDNKLTNWHEEREKNKSV